MYKRNAKEKKEKNANAKNIAKKNAKKKMKKKKKALQQNASDDMCAFLDPNQSKQTGSIIAPAPTCKNWCVELLCHTCSLSVRLRAPPSLNTTLSASVRDPAQRRQEPSSFSITRVKSPSPARGTVTARGSDECDWLCVVGCVVVGVG